MDKAIFGPAGNSEDFYSAGFSASAQIPQYLKDIGLGAYEYQCGRGVNVGEKTALLIGGKAKENGIFLSIHAPYYISMSNPDAESMEKTIKYITDAAVAAGLMGAKRIVVHTGSLMKMDRNDAMQNVKNTLKEAIKACDDMHLGDISICPETMGKTNQLGNLFEVLDLCTLDDRLIPTIDFGHLNARTFGGYKTYDDFLHIFDDMENMLGKERAKNFHAHFSKIEYTVPGGEKRHLTFEDQIFGPDFSFVAKILVERGLTPVVICESAGTQTTDAKIMQDIYEKCLKHL